MDVKLEFIYIFGGRKNFGRKCVPYTNSVLEHSIDYKWVCFAGVMRTGNRYKILEN